MPGLPSPALTGAVDAQWARSGPRIVRHQSALRLLPAEPCEQRDRECSVREDGAKMCAS